MHSSSCISLQLEGSSHFWLERCERYFLWWRLRRWFWLSICLHFAALSSQKSNSYFNFATGSLKSWRDNLVFCIRYVPESPIQQGVYEYIVSLLNGSQYNLGSYVLNGEKIEDVSDSQDFCGRLAQTRWPMITETYSLIFLEAGSPKPWAGQNSFSNLQGVRPPVRVIGLGST